MTTGALSRTETGLAPIVLTVLLGLGILFVVGFADAGVLHAAAHDGRHSISFPCH